MVNYDLKVMILGGDTRFVAKAYKKNSRIIKKTERMNHSSRLFYRN